MAKGNKGGKRGGINSWKKRTGITFASELDKVLSDEQKIELMKQVESATSIFGYDNAVDQLVTIIDGGASADAYASYTRGSGNIHLNTYYYDGNYEKMAKSYENDVNGGWHPKGTDWRSIIAHETGHAIEDRIGNAYLDQLYVEKRGNVSFDMHFKYAFGAKGTHDIVNRAVKNVKKSGVYGKNVSSYQIKYKLSEYATKNQSETFAEAIADYSKNGSRSNPLTLEIIKLTKEKLGR